MKLSDLSGLSFTYPDVGGTAGELPAGYHHARTFGVIGSGRVRFEEAGAAGMAWGMLRGAGMRIESTYATAEVGAEVIVTIGPLRNPCRVVYVLDEPDRRGFAYGTLPGHGVAGEELFSVRFDPVTEAVYAEVVAFSRPAVWWSHLGGPVTPLLQGVIARRYLRAL
ncbi:MAG: DUF1990 family protein [Mycobacterium sp.]